jgi:SAM-dependent methyltransferase
MAIPFSDLYKRNYTTLDVVEGYRRWSPSYDKGSDDNFIDGLLDRLHPDLWQGMENAVDLGCGTGRVGSWLCSHGINAVTGVDICVEMLALAASRNIYRELIDADVRKTGLPAEGFSLVFSSLTGCHLQDLQPLYDEAARLLVSGGTFVLMDYHPFFLLNGIPTHFKTEDGETFAITNYIHLFSDHFRTGTSSGLSLAALHELVVDETWKNYSKYINQPISFAIAWEK